MNTPETDKLSSIYAGKRISSKETAELYDKARELETQRNELREALEMVAAQSELTMTARVWEKVLLALQKAKGETP